jgi:hypothetical protein
MLKNEFLEVASSLYFSEKGFQFQAVDYKSFQKWIYFFFVSASLIINVRTKKLLENFVSKSRI